MARTLKISAEQKKTTEEGVKFFKEMIPSMEEGIKPLTGTSNFADVRAYVSSRLGVAYLKFQAKRCEEGLARAQLMTPAEEEQNRHRIALGMKFVPYIAWAFR